MRNSSRFQLVTLTRSAAFLFVAIFTIVGVPIVSHAQSSTQIPSIPVIPETPESPETQAEAQRQQSQAPVGDESGLTISPAIVDNTVDAGASFTVPITLGNITSRAVPIEVTKGKLETDQTPDAVSQGKYDISNWFTIDTTSFLLPLQDRRTVNITVKVPQNAEPGGHYATVFFGALAPSTGSASGETLLNARVGVVFLLTVRGVMNAGAEITDGIQTDATQWHAGATKFSFAIRNTGNVHFQPRGSLVIKDIFGRKVKELPLEPGIVLPGGQRKYELAWERGMRPGYYTAEVKADAGVQLKAESKRFLILPTVLAIPVGILLLVLGLAFWRARRVKKRRARRAAALDAITAKEPGEEPSNETGKEEAEQSPEVSSEASNLQQSPEEEQQ